jgi:hypothetical protein
MMSICNRQFTRIENRELTWAMCYPDCMVYDLRWEPFDDVEAAEVAAIYREQYNISLNKEKFADRGTYDYPYFLTVTFDNAADEAAFIIAIS